MKAATGELNLTVITIVAIAGIMGVFATFLWPNIKKSITEQWNNISSDSNTIVSDSRLS